jgi:hypothetical protein
MLLFSCLIDLKIGLIMIFPEPFAAACRTTNFKVATETCYRNWIVDFLQFHRLPDGTWVHPAVLRAPGVEAYLSELAVRHELSASSQSQAMYALVFFKR